VVQLAPEAATAFDNYRNSDFVDRFDEFEDIASFMARYAEQATRMALVLHTAKHGPEAVQYPVSKDTADAGVEIARWFSGRQLAFMARSRAEKRREKTQELHELVSRGPITLRDLQRRNGYDPKNVRALAKEFSNLLVVETRKPDGGGRPSEILRTNSNS
jgi:hypothetical protein